MARLGRPKGKPNPVEEKKRFMSFIAISKTGCWLWCGTKTKGYVRYGQYSFRGKNLRANRASWILFRGPIPKGMNALHKCDRGLCVNPNHLFLGTRQDNMDDASSKDRWPTKSNGRWRNKQPKSFRGETHPTAVLTNNQVLEIRKLRNDGMKIKDIAVRFDLNTAHCWKIAKGQRYKYVGGLNG